MRRGGGVWPTSPVRTTGKRTIAGELLGAAVARADDGLRGEGRAASVGRAGQAQREKDGVYVSVSHSGPWAVCVTADAPVGVDVEVVRSAQEKFMRRVCSEQEMAYIRPGDDGDCQRFWEIWTAKEALFKLTGKGPLLALSRFSLAGRRNAGLYGTKGCALTIAAQIL